MDYIGTPNIIEKADNSGDCAIVIRLNIGIELSQALLSMSKLMLPYR